MSNINIPLQTTTRTPTVGYEACLLWLTGVSASCTAGLTVH